jgi:outer membrane protein assembly factor BamB
MPFLATPVDLPPPAAMEAGPFDHQPAGYEGSLDVPPVTTWTRRLPGTQPNSASRSDAARPLLVGPWIYVGTPGRDGLMRLSREDGSLDRSYPAAGPVKAEPVLVDSRVLFADGAGYVWCYDADAGREIWRHFTGAPVLARPQVIDAVVYVAALDNVVHALALDTGESLWQYTHPPDKTRVSDLELYGAPTPIPAGDRLLVGFHDGRLVALDPATGESAWERVVGEGRYPDLTGEPLVVGQNVYIGGFSGPFVAMDLATRNVLWRIEAGTAAEPALVDHTLVVAGTDGHLRAVDVTTGDLVWEWDSESPGALSRPQSTPAGILVGSSDGGLWLIDPADGEVTWTWDDGYMLSGVSEPPAIDGRQAVVVTNAGNLLSLVAPSTPLSVQPAGPVLGEAW